jgi:hypothetical protein
MNKESTLDKLNKLKKLGRVVTTAEIIRRGLKVLEKTGLPSEDVEDLAHRYGLELDDIAYTVASPFSFRCEPAPVQVKADVVQLITEIHEVVVKQLEYRLALLSQIERDLYEVADEQRSFRGKELCLRTGIHDLDSRTKQCLSNLVKLGLLTKVIGGYLKTPAKS